MKLKVPVWEKMNLTIEEASVISNIGDYQLREITDSEDCPFVLWIGRKRLIKKRQFLAYIDRCYSL